MTQRCGLKPNAEEHILSEYAIKGDRYAYLDAIEKDFTVQKSLKGFWQVRFKENLHRGCNWWRPELKSEQELIDIGASTQEAFERMMMRISTSASFKPSKNSIDRWLCVKQTYGKTIEAQLIVFVPTQRSHFIGAVLEWKEHILTLIPKYGIIKYDK